MWRSYDVSVRVNSLSGVYSYLAFNNKSFTLIIIYIYTASDFGLYQKLQQNRIKME